MAYYHSLTEKAERRERHAKWIIDRYNLSKKRNEYLERDRLKVEHEIEVEEERRKKPPQSATITGVDTTTSSLGNFASVAILGLDETDQSPAAAFTNDATLNLLEEEEDDDDDGDILSASYNAATVKSSIWDDIRTESISDDAVAVSKVNRIYDADQSLSEAKDILYPQTGKDSISKVKLVYDADQSLSEAKGILYPQTGDDISDSLTSSYQSKYESGVGSSVGTREPLGSTAFEGSTAKNILYPTGESPTNVAQHRSAHGDEGAETKNLLYPSKNEAIVTAPAYSSKVAAEGTFTKSLLYPDSLDDAPKSSHVSKADEEGKFAKSLLYPGESGDSSYKHVDVDQRQVDDGAETKGLLYRGHEMEPAVNKSTRGGMRTDYGQAVKDMLYPSNDLTTTDVMPRNVTRDEGVETKGLIYSGENLKNVLQTTAKIHSFTEGSETKSLLYPSMTESRSADGYSYSSADVSSKVKSRGFEPATRIKEMMYPVVKEKGSSSSSSLQIRPRLQERIIASN